MRDVHRSMLGAGTRVLVMEWKEFIRRRMDNDPRPMEDPSSDGHGLTAGPAREGGHRSVSHDREAPR